ncbi:hypothetical protein FIV42_15640 [Persicimonas caeni]|uniref:Excalibur calcium-binding domain-containing protein n=1 Tax=Persicimonas caeni TaxID=2292766 RepID=A0A4Y6Q2T8_PERCE|nr:hypothetical protein FIV42_15640 [Persicimonas caeni]QED36122.1 hypothetical protein FRD00_15635 [Persicimonas caeni]
MATRYSSGRFGFPSFDACGTDVHRLDGDNDEIPCESLCD